MDDPIKKEFPHNILRPQQDWSFIDKWFDDYGHTLEPREIARWAYSNGKWNKWIETLDGEVGEAEITQMLDDIEYYQNRVEELEKLHKDWLLICKKCGDDLGIGIKDNET